VQPYRTLLGGEGSEEQVTTKKARQELKRANGSFAATGHVVENTQF